MLYCTLARGQSSCLRPTSVSDELVVDVKQPARAHQRVKLNSSISKDVEPSHVSGTFSSSSPKVGVSVLTVRHRTYKS